MESYLLENSSLTNSSILKRCGNRWGYCRKGVVKDGKACLHKAGKYKATTKVSAVSCCKVKQMCVY